MSSAQNILVVEDEPLIAMMMEDFLDVLGRSVVGPVDGVAAAIALLDGGGVDAAILDVNLRGGEKSWPIADALASAGVPFVLATGGGDDMIPAEHRDRPRLHKPYTMDNVETVLASL